jgi:hypothetical protein
VAAAVRRPVDEDARCPTAGMVESMLQVSRRTAMQSARRPLSPQRRRSSCCGSVLDKGSGEPATRDVGRWSA